MNATARIWIDKWSGKIVVRLKSVLIAEFIFKKGGSSYAEISYLTDIWIPGTDSYLSRVGMNNARKETCSK